MKLLKALFLALLIVAFTPCCARPLPPRVAPHDPAGGEVTRVWSWPADSYPLDVYTFGGSKCVDRALANAIQFWEAKTGVDLFKEPRPLTTAEINGYVLPGITVMPAFLGSGVAGGTSIIGPEVDVFASLVQLDKCDSQVMAHELGHALGLGHSADPGDVMYWFLIPGSWHVSAEMVDALRRPWAMLKP